MNARKIITVKIKTTYGVDASVLVKMNTESADNMHALLQIWNTCRHYAFVGRLILVAASSRLVFWEVRNVPQQCSRWANHTITSEQSLKSKSKTIKFKILLQCAYTALSSAYSASSVIQTSITWTRNYSYYVPGYVVWIISAGTLIYLNSQTTVTEQWYPSSLSMQPS